MNYPDFILPMIILTTICCPSKNVINKTMFNVKVSAQVEKRAQHTINQNAKGKHRLKRTEDFDDSVRLIINLVIFEELDSKKQWHNGTRSKMSIY